MLFRIVSMVSDPMHSTMYKCATPCCMRIVVQKYTGMWALCAALCLYAQCPACMRSAPPACTMPHKFSLCAALKLYAQRSRFLRPPIRCNSVSLFVKWAWWSLKNDFEILYRGWVGFFLRKTHFIIFVWTFYFVFKSLFDAFLSLSLFRWMMLWLHSFFSGSSLAARGSALGSLWE